MLERFWSTIRIADVANLISTRHVIKSRDVASFHHPLEKVMFDNLNTSSSGIFVHWGVYESGKSTAIKNVGLRLQEEGGRTVILLHGFNFSWEKSMHPWLRHAIGIPKDSTEPISTYFNKPTTVIIDHFDMLMRDERADETLKFLRELAIECVDTQKFNVFIAITSWERAIQLRENGCKLIGSPSKWTRDELTELFSSFPEKVQNLWTCQERKNELLRLATLSGTPGFLAFESYAKIPCSKRALLLDFEWRKGIRALDGNAQKNDEGRFPDKNGLFHWDDPKHFERINEV